MEANIQPPLEYVIVTLFGNGIGDIASTELKRSIRLDHSKPSVTIGRSSTVITKGCTVSADTAWFHNQVMSRNHAELTANLNTGSVEIRDCKSMHGTKVNDKKLVVNQPETLKNGDKIEFGIAIRREQQDHKPTCVTVGLESVPRVAEKVAQGTSTFSLPDVLIISDDEDYMNEGESPALPMTTKSPTPSQNHPVIDLTSPPREMSSPASAMPTEVDKILDQHLAASRRASPSLGDEATMADPIASLSRMSMEAEVDSQSPLEAVAAGPVNAESSLAQGSRYFINSESDDDNSYMESEDVDDSQSESESSMEGESDEESEMSVHHSNHGTRDCDSGMSQADLDMEDEFGSELAWEGEHTSVDADDDEADEADETDEIGETDEAYEADEDQGYSDLLTSPLEHAAQAKSTVDISGTHTGFGHLLTRPIMHRDDTLETLRANLKRVETVGNAANAAVANMGTYRGFIADARFDRPPLLPQPPPPPPHFQSAYAPILRLPGVAHMPHSPAQTLGEKTGKIAYFAAREVNKHKVMEIEPQGRGLALGRGVPNWSCVGNESIPSSQPADLYQPFPMSLHHSHFGWHDREANLLNSSIVPMKDTAATTSTLEFNQRKLNTELGPVEHEDSQARPRTHVDISELVHSCQASPSSQSNNKRKADEIAQNLTAAEEDYERDTMACAVTPVIHAVEAAEDDEVVEVTEAVEAVEAVEVVEAVKDVEDVEMAAAVELIGDVKDIEIPSTRTSQPSNLAMAEPVMGMAAEPLISPEVQTGNANEQSCHIHSAKRRRVRDIAERVAYAALGGVTVGAVVMGSLIYTAPTF